MERNNYIIIHNVSNFHHITVYQHDPVFELNKSVIYKKKTCILRKLSQIMLSTSSSFNNADKRKLVSCSY